MVLSVPKIKLATIYNQSNKKLPNVGEISQQEVKQLFIRQYLTNRSHPATTDYIIPIGPESNSTVCFTLPVLSPESKKAHGAMLEKPIGETEITWVLQCTGGKYHIQPKNIGHSIAINYKTNDPLNFLEDTRIMPCLLNF